MSEHSTTAGTAPAARPAAQPHPLASPPWIGLLGVVIPLVWKMPAHALSVILHRLFPGPEQYVVGAMIGLAGFTLMWQGMKRDELAGTMLGFMGGAFIWIGWFEYSFLGFSRMLEVEAAMRLSPNLLMMEASAVILLAMLIFTGANKDTRCRMFMWFHRNFGLKPGQPTPGYRRQFARIAAMEMVFISWFFYVMIILLIDSRILGPQHAVTYVVTAAMLLWGVWLVAAKMRPYRSMAGAIRYGIPVAGILWFVVEMTAVWRWYIEPWVRPFDYPLANAGFFALFLGLLFTAWRLGRPAS